MVSDIDSVAVAFRIGRLAQLDFQAEDRRQLAKQVTEGGDVLRITRTEQTINTAEDADQNTIDDNDN